MKQSGMYAEGGESKSTGDDELAFRRHETETEIWLERTRLAKDVRTLKPELEHELRRLYLDRDRDAAAVAKVRELAEKMAKHEMAKTTNSAGYSELKEERLKLWGIYIVRDTSVEPPIEDVRVVPAASTMQAFSKLSGSRSASAPGCTRAPGRARGGWERQRCASKTGQHPEKGRIDCRA